MTLENRKKSRDKRHRRVRRKIRGTAEKPRMAMMVSCRYMYVQFIDDENGRTLASATSLGSESKNNLATAKALGRRSAEVALSKGIKDVVVDRGGFKFHGRVKAIVDGAVEAGISIGIKKEK